MNKTANNQTQLTRILLCFVLLTVSFGTCQPVYSQDEVSQAAGQVQSDLMQDVSAAQPPNEFQGMPLFDDDIYKMAVRFSINLLFLILVVVVSYCPHQKGGARYVFNFMIMNIVVFFICFTLKKLQMELGMALGLFAIFTILRYRTDQINVKDMTYLFVVIGLAVINALSNRKSSYVELLFANSMIFLATLILERALVAPAKAPKLQSRDIVYDNLELLKPDREEDLKSDLFKRTGIQAERVEVKKIDLKQGSATVSLRFPKQK